MKKNVLFSLCALIFSFLFAISDVNATSSKNSTVGVSGVSGVVTGIPTGGVNVGGNSEKNDESDPYNNSDVVYNTCTISCGDVKGIPENLPVFTRRVINVVKVLVPVVLVIMGMIDFLKAVTSNDEKVMAESPKIFIRRIIVSVLIFLVIVIIQFVVRLISDASIKSGNEKNPAESVAECISCFISDKEACGVTYCE